MGSEGVHRNIFNVIDSTVYSGDDSTPISNPDARGGEESRVYGPNQKIMDTGWSDFNAWNGAHALTCRWFSNLTNEKPGLLIEYWKKDADGNQSLKSYNIRWVDSVSPKAGNGAGFLNFSENNQYRILVKSHPTLAETDWVAMDYLKINPIDNWTVKSSAIFPSGNFIAAPRVYGKYYVVTNDGSSPAGSLTVSLPFNEESVHTIPNCNVYGSLLDNFYANIGDISEDKGSFSIRVMRRDGAVWSGGVSVLCLMLYFPPITEI